jgi:hypothetical protein
MYAQTPHAYTDRLRSCGIQSSLPYVGQKLTVVYRKLERMVEQVVKSKDNKPVLDSYGKPKMVKGLEIQSEWLSAPQFKDTIGKFDLSAMQKMGPDREARIRKLVDGQQVTGVVTGYGSTGGGTAHTPEVMVNVDLWVDWRMRQAKTAATTSVDAADVWNTA